MNLFPEIWDSVEKSAPRYLLRLSLIETELKQLPQTCQSVLEIGPGRGDVASHLLATRPDVRLTLCESGDAAFAHLEERFGYEPRVDLVRDLSVVAKDSVDAVLVFEVLEHIDDDAAFLAQALAPLRSGGALVLSVPAYMKKWQHQDEWAGHVRRYEYDELLALLHRFDVEPIALHDFGFPFMNLIQPLKFLYYRSESNKLRSVSTQDKTAASGVSRSSKVSILSRMVMPVLACFARAQTPFRQRRWGDGFVAVGTYRV